MISGRDDKVKLTKYQIHHHHGGVFGTWTKWAKRQAKRAQGLAGHVLCRFGLWLRGHVSTRAVEDQGGEECWWRPLHMASRPPVGAKPSSPSQWSSPRALYIPPYSGNENTHTPHFRDSTCKALILSVVARCSHVGRVVRL